MQRRRKPLLHCKLCMLLICTFLATMQWWHLVEAEDSEAAANKLVAAGRAIIGTGDERRLVGLDDVYAAIEHFKSALEVEPLHEVAFRSLVDVIRDIYVSNPVACEGVVDNLETNIGMLTYISLALSGIVTEAHKEKYLRRSLDLSPSNPLAVSQLSFTLLYTWRPEEAKKLLDDAIQLQPRLPSLHLLRASACPPFYRDQGEAVASIAEVRERLSALEVMFEQNDGMRSPDPSFVLGWPPCYNWQYSGLPMKSLMESMCRTLLLMTPDLGRVEMLAAPVVPKTRLRVGLVLERPAHNHSPMKLIQGLVEGLDKSRIELIVFTPAGSAYPKSGFAILEAADKVVHLLCEEVQTVPSTWPTRKAVAEEHIDVLIFIALGNTLWPQVLALGRLAPVQISYGHGHPVTSGSQAVDYYVSTDAFEQSADPHLRYTEQLVLFDKLPTFPKEDPVPAGVAAAARRAHGIEPHQHLYHLVQHSKKFHPKYDDVIVGILSSDPLAKILMLQSTVDTHMERLKTKLSDELFSRLVLLPYLPFDELQALTAASDVFLDTFPFGTGITAGESLAHCVPVVSLPSEVHLSTLAAGLLLYLGLGEELIASSIPDYVNRAVHFSSGEPARQIRAKICEPARLAMMYDHTDAIEEWHQFLERVWAFHGDKYSVIMDV